MRNEKIQLFTSIGNLERVNERFAKVKIRIAYDGENRNKSYISKEVFEKAIPTLKFVPVVGYYLEDEEMFDGHTEKLEIIDDEWTLKTLTKPYGVVTDEKPFWEDVKTLNGEMKSYLTCYAMLWIARYPELEGIKEGDFAQSMEIICNKGYWSEDDGLYHIEDLTFDALCILQKKEACFEDSVITLSFSKDKFEDEYKSMITELKEYTLKNFEQGGEKMAKKRKCSKCETEIEVDYEFDENEEFICDSCKESDFSKKENFELSFDEIREKLRNSVKTEGVYCWVVQTFSDYFIYEEETWRDDNYEVKFYKQGYSLDNNEVKILDDKVEVFARFITQEEMDKLEEEKSNYDNKISTLKADFTDLTSELENLKTEHATLKAETEELKEYKANIEFEQHKAEVDEVLAKYSELETVDGYSELVKEKYTADIKELEKAIKVFAFDNGVVLNKKISKKSFSKETVKIPLLNNNNNEIVIDPYDGILDKYIKN